MTKPKLLFILTAAVLFAAPHALALPGDVGVALSAEGQSRLEHAPDRPLLFMVNVADDRGPVKNAKPRFEVRDASGKEVRLNIHKLASNSAGAGLYYFGADPADLSALPEGTYAVRASEGKAVSPPVTLVLKKGAPASDQTEGLYYRLDRQFDKLLAHADGMILKNPQIEDGLIFKGDALAGLGKKKEAVVAFKQALKLHNDNAALKKRALKEEPVYINERIEEIQDELSK